MKLTGSAGPTNNNKWYTVHDSSIQLHS